MKKTYTILILLIFIFETLHAQKWQHLFGMNNYSEHVMDVTEAYDKGYLINGDFEDNEKNWLIKTDINGNLLWDKYFIWSDNGYLYWGYVDQDNLGNTYVSCQFSKPGVGTWPLLLKLNTCGELLWCKVFADYDYWFGFPTDFHIFENGDVLILTHFESEEQIDQTFLYYITTDGEFQWKKSVASKTDFPLIDARNCSRLNYFNNRFIISGFCYYPYPGNPIHVYLRPFFVSLDQDFNEIFVLPYGVSDSLLGVANNVIPLTDSTYLGVGERRFADSKGLVSNSLLMFFNNEGEELGYNQIYNSAIGPNIQSNFISDIERIDEDLFITTSQFGEEESGNPNGEFVIDTSGAIFAVNTQPNTKSISELLKTFDGKYTISTNFKINSKYDILLYKINKDLFSDTAYNSLFVYDSLCPYQITSETIDLTGSAIITDVSKYPTRDNFLKQQNKVSIKVVPNPAANGLVNILISDAERYHELELYVFNVFGQKVDHATLEKETECLLINTQEWPSGIYLVTLLNQNRSIGQAKMIIQ